jgi:hypothetical protein
MAFEAYNASRGGVTYDGKPIPPWGEVGDEVRAAWEASASAVMHLAYEIAQDEADEQMDLPGSARRVQMRIYGSVGAPVGWHLHHSNDDETE